MTPSFVAGFARARVPATSANLGPGFDALGLALGLHDEVTAQVTAGGLHIDIDGAGSDGAASDGVPRDERHLVVRVMREVFAELGGQPPGLALSCVNRIPHGRGLGSSAAAIVAGVLLARALVTDGDRQLADADVLATAARIEGHPDNVAPCLLGGLTIAWFGADGGARAVRRKPDPAVVPVALVPPFAASTEQARALLPPTVPHADAAFNAGRAALLVAALTGTPQALFDATAERLHQSYRAPALGDSVALVEALRERGHAAVVSGAGPTVLVLALGDVEAAHVTQFAPAGWAVHVPGVDVTGAMCQRLADAR